VCGERASEIATNAYLPAQVSLPVVWMPARFWCCFSRWRCPGCLGLSTIRTHLHGSDNWHFILPCHRGVARGLSCRLTQILRASEPVQATEGRKHSCLTGRRRRLLPLSARPERANASEFRTREPSASISEQQLPIGVLALKHQRHVGINQTQRQISMRNAKLHRTIILAAAIALGCVSATVDAFARSGAGGAGGGGVGHAAPSGGVASGHASTAPHGTTGGASHAHATDGGAIIRVGHGFVPD
jgi:hypothetical protein